MGKKNKTGPKANVFKVAGAKSLKKTKAKPVNLSLKNMKQKVVEIDKQFLEINKNPKQKDAVKAPIKPPQKKKDKLPKEEVNKAAEEICKMDL